MISKILFLTASLSFFHLAHAENLKVKENSSKLCLSLAKLSRPKAEVCMKINDRSKRSKCLESIGQIIKKEDPKETCEFFLEPIKQEFVKKEKQLYPNQDPALK